MVGIGRVVMARRERIMMLEPFGKGIMGTLLLYPYEIRGEEAVFEDIPDRKLPDQMVGLAEEIIDRMSGAFEPDKFEDRYEQAMVELIRTKQAGMPAPKEKAAARPANVVNLTDALRRSVQGTGGKTPRHPLRKRPLRPAQSGKRAAKTGSPGPRLPFRARRFHHSLCSGLRALALVSRRPAPAFGSSGLLRFPLAHAMVARIPVLATNLGRVR
jgi:DNA end-binding protein Ku